MGKQKTVSMDLRIWILAYWTAQNDVKGSKIHLETKWTPNQYHLRTNKTKSIVQELFYSFVYLFFFLFTKIHDNAWDLNLPSVISVCAKKKEWITARCPSFYQMNRRSQAPMHKGLTTDRVIVKCEEKKVISSIILALFQFAIGNYWFPYGYFHQHAGTEVQLLFHNLIFFWWNNSNQNLTRGLKSVLHKSEWNPW